MTVLRRFVLLVIVTLALAPAAAARQPSSQPSSPPSSEKPLEEFVPIDELPPADQMPAAPLVVAAYAFVWVAFFGYVMTVARRLGTVQREVERLEGDVRAGKR
jgi:CcmD family protein